MKLYRIERKKYLKTTLTGIGASMTKGYRWNSLNTKLVYTTESRALATLEISVHLDLLEDLPTDRYFVEIDVPNNISLLEVKLEDLPDDLKVENIENMNDWTKVLQTWSESYLAKGNNNLLEEAIPNFERTIIKVALNKTLGRKKEAAELLGWGRNTLTRKIKELGLDN